MTKKWETWNLEWGGTTDTESKSLEERKEKMKKGSIQVGNGKQFSRNDKSHLFTNLRTTVNLKQDE